MLAPGSKFPEFALAATTTLDHPKVPFPTISNDTYKGKWLVVFFWPKDFTFVCPTEIAAFGKLNSEFEDRDARSSACRPTTSSFITLGGPIMKI